MDVADSGADSIDFIWIVCDFLHYNGITVFYVYWLEEMIIVYVLLCVVLFIFSYVHLLCLRP